MPKRTFTEEEVFNLELKAHNAGAENGRNDERRRIIALLKAVDDELGIFAAGWTMQEIAELIKGENE